MLEPSEANCRNGSYPFARGIYLLAALDPKDPDPILAEFLRYVDSLDGQRQVRAAGAVPRRELAD